MSVDIRDLRLIINVIIQNVVRTIIDSSGVNDSTSYRLWQLGRVAFFHRMDREFFFK